MPNRPALSGLRNNFWAIHGSMAAVAAGATAAGIWGPTAIRFGTGIVFGAVGTLAVWQAEIAKKAPDSTGHAPPASPAHHAGSSDLEAPAGTDLGAPGLGAPGLGVRAPDAFASAVVEAPGPGRVGGDLFREDVFTLGSFDDRLENVVEGEPENVGDGPGAGVGSGVDAEPVDGGLLADEAVAGWPGYESGIVPNLPRQVGPRMPVERS